jgi:hypothetical protein
VIGDQRLDNDIEIQNETSIPFFLHGPTDVPVPSSCDSSVTPYRPPSAGCYIAFTFETMGLWEHATSIDNRNSGDVDGTFGNVKTYNYKGYTPYDPDGEEAYNTIQITIPSFNEAGNYGFSIQFLNGISNIKYENGTMDVTQADNMKPATEVIQLLDPGPVGTGEWVQVVVPKWDFLWVLFIRYLKMVFQILK